MAGQVITKVSANSGTHLISTSFYGTCATAAGTAAKAVIINDPNITDAITLVNGMTLAVKFVASNSVANPTITVYNNSGTAAAPAQGSTTLIAAKSIYQVNINLNAAGTAASTSAATSWKSGATVIFVYDGQGWVEASSTYNQDSNTTALTSMTGTLAVNHGGTGITSNTVNSVLIGGTTTTGAIQNVAAASGALYSTGANVKPTFGTLPIAQGGTGKTTATEAWTALGGGAIGKKASLTASDIPNLAASKITSGTLAVAQGGNGVAIGKKIAENTANTLTVYQQGRVISVVAHGVSATPGANTALLTISQLEDHPEVLPEYNVSTLVTDTSANTRIARLWVDASTGDIKLAAAGYTSSSTWYGTLTYIATNA